MATPAPTDKPLSNRDISRAPMLDARAATRCPMRTHLSIDPPGPLVAVPLPEVLQVRFEEGRAFEAQVMAEIAAAGVSVAEVAPDEVAQAMADGVPVLAQPLLSDPVGRRTGRPDLLVRVPEPTAEGRPAYLPIDIKAHLVATTSSRGSLGPLRAVAHTDLAGLDPSAVPEREDTWLRRRPDDLLQLAHYHRLLAHLGHAGTPAGGVIGSDRHLAVLDLDAPVFQSWRTAKGRWTVLQKYDREFGFRLDVAALAADRAAGLTDEVPLVVPARSTECDTCPHLGWCDPQMQAADELTLLPGVDWNTRQRLHAQGITTRTALAAADPADLPTATIATAADHARVQASGHPLVRARGVVDLVLPRADVEVDVDMESTADGRVYLWGCLLTAGGSSDYVPFADFDADLDDTGLFATFWTWLMGVQELARAEGRTFAAYCYAAGGAENRYLRLYGPRLGIDVEGFIAGEGWVDLHAVVKAHVLTGGSLGLKAVARRCGFEWADEDPGGGQSMAWYAEAVAGDEAQRQRLLAYNADDVRATLAVRERLAARWDRLPSVESLAG